MGDHHRPLLLPRMTSTQAEPRSETRLGDDAEAGLVGLSRKHQLSQSIGPQTEDPLGRGFGS